MESFVMKHPTKEERVTVTYEHGKTNNNEELEEGEYDVTNNNGERFMCGVSKVRTKDELESLVKHLLETYHS